MQGCVRLRNALKFIEMHLGGYVYRKVELLTSKAAEKLYIRRLFLQSRYSAT